MDANTSQNHGTRDKPRVLLTGEYRHSEFSTAYRLLRAKADNLMTVKLSAAVEFIRAGSPSVDLIVIAQSRPGEISPSDLEALCHAAPQTHKLWLMGTWCEGERPLCPDPTILERSYWYAFPGWWRRFLGGMPTKSPHLHWNRNTPVPQRDISPGVILVDTPHFTSFETIASTLGEAGLAAVWWRSGQPPPVVAGASGGIWDGGQLSAREETALKLFCETISPVGPVVAILDFPRRDRVKLAKATGVSSVLGRPWLAEDLLAALRVSMPSANRTAWLQHDCSAA